MIRSYTVLSSSRLPVSCKKGRREGGEVREGRNQGRVNWLIKVSSSVPVRHEGERKIERGGREKEREGVRERGERKRGERKRERAR